MFLVYSGTSHGLMIWLIILEQKSPGKSMKSSGRPASQVRGQHVVLQAGKVAQCI